MYDDIKDYYGHVLSSSADLKTDACCTDEAMPEFLKPLLANVHDEVLMKYYGCGLVLPEELKGKRILDLGCGTGRDVYVLSQLVGEEGYVVGVDMTDNQLSVAKKYIDYHTKKFGFKKPNVEFIQGYIENLDGLDLKAESFDVVVSNCVINLSPLKDRVLKQVWTLLKPGGEMYFSDVYADKRLPKHLAEDSILKGECLGGALYWNDFLNLAKRAGFGDPRLVTDRPLLINNPEIAEKLSDYHFYSATYRLFKVNDLESHCEDYGQAVIYKGTISNHSQFLLFDKHHRIQAGRVFPVCGNTWRMLEQSRLASHFEFIGNFDKHFGIFANCGFDMPFTQNDSATDASGCC